MAQTDRLQDEHTLGQLFASASHDLSALMRSEVALAKAELRQDVRRAATGGAMMAAAGLFVALAVVLASVAAAHGIHALGITRGWSYLIVAGGYLVIALLLMLVGALAMRRIRPPERTIRTAKGNVALLKKQPSRPSDEGNGNV